MKFKLYIVLVITFLVTSVSNAQIFDPVKWTTSVELNEAKEVVLVSKASIEKGWHIYGQFIEEGGPVATKFYYPKDLELKGKTEEPKGHEFDDPTFEMRVKYIEGKAIFKQVLTNTVHANTLTASVEFMSCNDERCLAPQEIDLVYDLSKIQNTSLSEKSVDLNSVDAVEKSNKSYWLLFVLSFLAGLSALLTPCVFPMIPMTVSFFTKQSKNRAVGIKNAIVYGICIVVIYVLLGTLVVGVFGADALNKLSTSVAFNVIFFAILVFFALSFLGAYELVLPSSWGTKLDEKADRGGLVGIFFMALALAVVSFSCTGPIVGTALVESAAHGGVAPIISMLGFSMAIAIPFTLFAVFPGWMNSLPKSGGWLNTVKVVLGFLELALAFKFLSNADLVLQAHWLEREVFIAIWIVIFLLLGVYLLGKIRLPHDYQAVEQLSVARLLLAIASFTFVFYLLPGLFGAPVKLVGAFVPPLEYSESPNGLGGSGSLAVNQSHTDLPEGAHIVQPYNIMAFNDYDQGVEYAQKVNKPILLDFTGYACVNCRKMEQNVWTDQSVLDIIQNKVVLISLHVDDRKKFIKEQYSPKTGKPYRYKGQKWSELQEERYKTNAQPFYAVLNSDGNDLIQPVGYTPNVAEYLQWLKTGLEANK